VGPAGTLALGALQVREALGTATVVVFILAVRTRNATTTVQRAAVSTGL
jgi:hypothetical protein